LAGRWLAHFRHALDDAVSDQLARVYIVEKATTLAMAFNEGETPSALRARSHGACLRYRLAIESLGLAGRGDAAAPRGRLHRAPDVLASAPAPHAATLLQLAARSGHDAVIELRLGSGVPAVRETTSSHRTTGSSAQRCPSIEKVRRQLGHGATPDPPA
jgi:hypothetical protein